MILLDTNIISEMMKPIPEDNVLQWIDQQVVSELYITSTTIAEIAYGLYILAKGKRRRALEEAFDGAIMQAFNPDIS